MNDDELFESFLLENVENCVYLINNDTFYNDIFNLHTTINMNQFIKFLNLKSYYKFKKNDDKYIECSICYEIINHNTYIRKLNCDHNFHKKCIDKWLYTQFKENKDEYTCPLCRQKIEYS